MKKTNILFVCKYNRFRSRVAEAYFNKINKNKNIKAKSAGAIKGNPISKFTINIAKKFKINIKGQTVGISTKLLKWQNLTILVADDVPKSIFNLNKKYGKKTIVWKIADAKKLDKKEISNIIKKITKKVDKLVKDLETK